MGQLADEEEEPPKEEGEGGDGEDFLLTDDAKDIDLRCGTDVWIIAVGVKENRSNSSSTLPPKFEVFNAPKYTHIHLQA